MLFHWNWDKDFWVLPLALSFDRIEDTLEDAGQILFVNVYCITLYVLCAWVSVQIPCTVRVITKRTEN